MVLPYINMNPPRVYMSSQSCTPLPPPSPYHLSGSSQCTSPKHPVSCIEPRLAIRFLHDIIHVSMPFSQIIPPSPSPTQSKSLTEKLWGMFWPAQYIHLYIINQYWVSLFIRIHGVSKRKWHRIFLNSIYMKFRKMAMITLYAGQQKRHRCIEQTFGLCGRGRGWDDLGEWHWNIYKIM